MNLPQLKAVIQGYEDHLFDLKCIAVYTGYWSAYYNNTKRPKPVSTVLQEMLKGHKKSAKSATKTVKPEVDVEAFLRQEEQFNKRLKGR